MYIVLALIKSRDKLTSILIDIRAVLVRDPECAISGNNESFIVPYNTCTAITWPTETVTCEVGTGQDWSLFVLDIRTRGGSVESRDRVAPRVSQENGVLIPELDVVGDRSGIGVVIYWGEVDFESVVLNQHSHPGSHHPLTTYL